MRFTHEQYQKAIEHITDASTQLEPNGNGCHCCGDSGHQAFECGWNPLLAVAMCHDIAKRAEELHAQMHALDIEAMPLRRDVPIEVENAHGKLLEELHEFLHHLAGHNTRMGEQTGPARIKPL